MANTTPAGAPPLIDNPVAPEGFADELTGVFLWNGNVHFTFATLRSDYRTDPGNPGVMSRVVMGRLVMPLAAARGLHEFLGRWLDGLKPQDPVDSQDTPAKPTLQ